MRTGSGLGCLCWDNVVRTSPARRGRTVVGSSCAGVADCSDRSEGSAGSGQRISVLFADHADMKQQNALHLSGLSLTHMSGLPVYCSPLCHQCLRW